MSNVNPLNANKLTFSKHRKPSELALMKFPLIADNVLELIPDKLFCRINNFLSLKANLFLKIEGFNPAGSIKIKPAIRMLEVLEEKGLIFPGFSHIIESSSGNLGAR